MKAIYEKCIIFQIRLFNHLNNDLQQIVMRVEILLILVISALSHSSYKRYTDYQQYLSQWKKIVPQEYIHNVTDIATDQQICYGKKCQFFYYQSEDKSVVDPIRQKIVLLVSGMHGNQFLGPHTLLYAYKHLKGYKIIYFPMANPSGFLRQTRQTYPNKIDPNRDFPIDGNTICYQTSATNILDMLFRKYRFDLTVILHNGGTQIGFNWGTTKHAANSHTEQYNIYLDISQMMQQSGGQSSKLQLQKFPIGTMVETVYAAQGTFDDWAYAVGKFPDIITKCNNFEYKPYPKDMANGLAFLIEMGPFKTTQLGSEQGVTSDPLSDSSNNGHIARVIRILKTMMDVINPKLVIQFQNNTALLTVRGCKQANIKKLLIFSQRQDKTWFNIFQQNTPIQINKDSKNTVKIQLLQKIQINNLVRYLGSMECDSKWVGKGTTSFANPRLFQFQAIQKNTMKRSTQQYLLTQLQEIAVEWKYYIIVAIILILLLGFLIYWRCSKRAKIQKFEQVEIVSQRQSEHPQTEQQMGGDLHTARGGIINM